MSIKVVGVKGGLTIDEWVYLAKRMTNTVGDEQVFSGGVITVSGSNFVVSATECYMHGSVWTAAGGEATPIPVNNTASAQTVYIGGQTKLYDASSNPTTEDTAGSLFTSFSAPTHADGPLWQTGFYKATIAANSTSVSNLVDIRPLAAPVTVAFGGNWAANSAYPLRISKPGGEWRLAGRTTRTSSTLGAGDVTTFTLPQAYWPTNIASGFCSTGGDAATGVDPIHWHRLEIFPTGTASFRAGSDITPGTNVHIDMSWS